MAQLGLTEDLALGGVPLHRFDWKTILQEVPDYPHVLVGMRFLDLLIGAELLIATVVRGGDA